ncbi:hypothetical protein FSARC_7031 [Fusarium sarcochroum]|uniref:Uncharacterized protein n=1 Tax=Fusarium sarcochroum TaxID=1208366 RepID=A0A8H4X8S6_9HYPO|nr:hypothetical protein FSARC_7031 [Fusarium sarcochroum]
MASPDRTKLYLRYKECDDFAFTALCGLDYRNLTTSDLINSSKRQLSPAKKAEIVSKLQESCQYRREIQAFYGPEISDPKRSTHAYFLKALSCIIENLSPSTGSYEESEAIKDNIAERQDLLAKGSITSRDQHPFEERTIDQEDFLDFLEELKSLCAIMFRSFDKSEEMGYIGVSLVFDAVFLELESRVNQARLLCQHWFDEHGCLKAIAPHAFLGELEEVLGEDAMEKFGELCEFASRINRGSVPKIIFVTILCQYHDDFPLIGQIARFIFRQTRRPISQDLRSSAMLMCDRVRQCSEGLPNLFPSKDFLTTHATHESILERCDDILLFNKLFTIVALNCVTTYRIILNHPLIPALFHVYTYMLLNNETAILQELEEFCGHAASASALFWDERPSSHSQLLDSLWEWVIQDGRHNRAQSIAERRYRSLVTARLTENDGVLDGTVLKLIEQRGDQTMWDALLDRIKVEMSIPDVNVLWTLTLTVVRILKNNQKLDSKDAARFLCHLCDGLRNVVTVKIKEHSVEKEKKDVRKNLMHMIMSRLRPKAA